MILWTMTRHKKKPNTSESSLRLMKLVERKSVTKLRVSIKKQLFKSNSSKKMIPLPEFTLKLSRETPPIGKHSLRMKKTV